METTLNIKSKSMLNKLNFKSMKKFLLNTLVFMLMTISSCAQNQSTLRIDENTDLNKIEKELISHFQNIEILKNITNMHSFELDKAENGLLLVLGQGTEFKDGIDWNVSFRVVVVEQLLSVMAESCSGNNCEKCKFVSKGGCDCERVGSVGGGASYCNHTTTRGFVELINSY